jgi:hypothetical protein
MMCYKDMTFCPFFGNCAKRDTCHRPLTTEVVIAAEKLGLPVSQFAEKPECHVEDDTNTKEDNG